MVKRKSLIIVPIVNEGDVTVHVDIITGVLRDEVNLFLPLRLGVELKGITACILNSIHTIPFLLDWIYHIKFKIQVSKYVLVRAMGFEPIRLSARVFETLVSAVPPRPLKAYSNEGGRSQSPI